MRVQVHIKLQFLTNLAGFETKFDLHLAGLGSDPHVHLRRENKGNEAETQKLIQNNYT